ncbi:Calcium-independent phospholipase A2-gamma [Holothuria leucospilota]|uniref:Calcium-independent phospholipase A2-gamma n=1 Tax=Holothuria leucospilota TaxID=206669 RepID=A0A9Q1HJ17_HOLLE|nr:Calcium-independent phospholipase A2-gamma [Holothuria leucospilota]
MCDYHQILPCQDTIIPEPYLLLYISQWKWKTWQGRRRQGSKVVKVAGYKTKHQGYIISGLPTAFTCQRFRQDEVQEEFKDLPQNTVLSEIQETPMSNQDTTEVQKCETLQTEIDDAAEISESQGNGETLSEQSYFGATSRFAYGIFDRDIMMKRIQENFNSLKSLQGFTSGEGQKEVVSPELSKKSDDRKSLMHFSEEFETGSQGSVYGDVIIQFKQRPDKKVEEGKVPDDPSVASIFRESLYDWNEERRKNATKGREVDVKNADTRGDISQQVASSFQEEGSSKSDFSSIMDQISRLRSLQLPTMADSVQRFNQKFVREQMSPKENGKEKVSLVDLQSEDDVGGVYFDTNSPLIDMTQVIGEMQVSGTSEKAKSSLKREEKTKLQEGRGPVSEEKLLEEEFQPSRKVQVRVSQSSIRARTKSLAVAVSKPSSTVSKLMQLRRLCKHLSEYPETRDIAVKENLIPILLRRRKDSDEVTCSEIRRALSLMGYADPVIGKGIRILSVDGGGSRGVVPIEILRKLEDSCEQRIGDMFDFVIGVSSGAVLAFLLSIAKVPLDECEHLYKELSKTVFGRNRFLGTSNLFLNHAFYDTEVWMKILSQLVFWPFSFFSSDIEPYILQVASVATLMNVGTLRDFLFRNYNLPPGSVSFYQGSSKYRLWEALRASSAAPGYFEEFKLDDYVFQDGGVLTNNPCALAVHECRLLWPDTPIQCVVSVGTGRYDPMDQEFPAELSSLKTKLIKVLCSATDTEAVHTILQDLLPAGKYFRFNPILSEEFLLDENRPEKLEKMQSEAREYLARNELKLTQATGVLTREKSLLDKAGDWIALQKKMRIPRKRKNDVQ